jgi:tRNA A-37 threonylcarbamoyl transferase component Bud32
MNQINLEIMSLPDIRKLAKECDIDISNKNKEDLIKSLQKVFKIVEKRRSKYTELTPIGYKGKEGTVFTVKDKKGQVFAMKKFRSGKSGARLENEAYLLEKACSIGISPLLIDYSRSNLWIVMEKLDSNLFDILKSTNGILTKKVQQQMIDIFKKLDEIQIFHADPNPLNFMFKDGKMYIIDYGFAKTFDEISVVNLHTRTPNMDYMPLGFFMKIKDNCDIRNFPVLIKHIPRDKLSQLGIA